MNLVVIIVIILAMYYYKNNYSRTDAEDIDTSQTGGKGANLTGFSASGNEVGDCSKFSYLNEPEVSPSSFTNNWLTSRHNDKLFSERYADFPLYDEQRVGDQVYATADNGTYRDILKTIQERSPVSDAFFSHKNLNHIKHLIAKLIKERYNYNINPRAQSDNELLIIMRSIYLQHAKHLEDQVMGQVSELNMKVLIEVIPRVNTNIQMELTYQRDQGSQPLPMARPVNISSAGTRSNKSVTDLFV